MTPAPRLISARLFGLLSHRAFVANVASISRLRDPSCRQEDGRRGLGLTATALPWFSLNVTCEPDGFARTALKLPEYRNVTPGKWEEILLCYHPGSYPCILQAIDWKKALLAEPDAAKP